MECGKDQDIMILIPLLLSIKGTKGNTDKIDKIKKYHYSKTK